MSQFFSLCEKIILLLLVMNLISCKLLDLVLTAQVLWNKLWSKHQSNMLILLPFPVDLGLKLNVHKTFRKRPGHLLNVSCTFNLRPVSTGLLPTL